MYTCVWKNLTSLREIESLDGYGKNVISWENHQFLRRLFSWRKYRTAYVRRFIFENVSKKCEPMVWTDELMKHTYLFLCSRLWWIYDKSWKIMYTNKNIFVLKGAALKHFWRSFKKQSVSEILRFDIFKGKK